MTNASGTVDQALAFDAWGLRRNASDWSALGSPFAGSHEIERGYTGHEHLDAVGLIHMNGRVQDPILGRFISADPLIQAPYQTQSHNRYSYVWNNPASMVDPSGFCAAWVPEAHELCNAIEEAEDMLFELRQQSGERGGPNTFELRSLILAHLGGLYIEDALARMLERAQIEIVDVPNGGARSQEPSDNVGSCGQVNCTPEDYTPSHRAAIQATIGRLAAPLMRRGYDSPQHAAAVLHDSRLNSYAAEQGIEFWAIIDEATNAIREVGTGYHYRVAIGARERTRVGDSVWHSHPSGNSDLSWDDLEFAFETGASWIFASGTTLSGWNTGTSPVNSIASMRRDDFDLIIHRYSDRQWSQEVWPYR